MKPSFQCSSVRKQIHASIITADKHPHTKHAWPTVQCGEDREETERELLALLITQSDTQAERPNLTCFSLS